MTLRIGFVVLILALRLSAQQPEMRLTLAEAQRLALQNNPSLSTARLNAEAAHQTPLGVKAARAPVFIGSVTGVGADSGSRLAAGGLNNPVLFSRVASGISVSQLLMDFGRTSHLTASADLRAQAQDQVSESTRADILIVTVRAYFSVLRGSSILKVAQQTVSARQLVSDQVTALFNSSLKSQLDVSFANVNLADAKLLVAQAQNEVKAAEASLAAVMGVSAQAGFVLAEEPMSDAMPEQVEPLIQSALQDRPELKSLKLERDAAERFAKAERALAYPTVAAMGAVGVAPAGDTNVPGRYGAAGLNVSIPVFNGGLFRARQREADLRARAAGERIKVLSNQIERDVRVAYLGAKTAFERVGLTNQLLQQAQLSLDLAQGRYDLGLGSIVELSQAQLNFTSAQIATASARYDYQAQKAVVDYQAGALR